MKQSELHAGVFLGLFFDPEDGANIFLRNADYYTALYST
jgi:hypothetical protein